MRGQVRSYIVKLQCSGGRSSSHRAVPIKPPLTLYVHDGEADIALGNQALIDGSPLTAEERELTFGVSQDGRRGGPYEADEAWRAAYRAAGRSRNVRKCNHCGRTLEAVEDLTKRFMETLAASPSTPWTIKDHGDRRELTLELASVSVEFERLRFI